MELKQALEKPYTEEERANFIVYYNRQLGYEIRETETALEAWGYTEQEETAFREEDFKSKFFEIPTFGWYRKEPKGYSSAVESLNTAFNAVTILQKLPANMLIFYQEPDFSDPEQCTEEWLIAHQIKNEEMTIQQFGDFYMAFMTAWNTEEHETPEPQPTEPTEPEPTEEEGGKDESNELSAD